MDFIKNHKIIVISITLIVVGFILYGVFFVDGETEALLSSATESGIDPEAGGEMLALLQELEDITIDVSLFSDPLFLSLEDYTVELRPQNVGRDNPFAPVDGVRSSQPTPPPPTDDTTETDPSDEASESEQ